MTDTTNGAAPAPKANGKKPAAAKKKTAAPKAAAKKTAAPKIAPKTPVKREPKPLDAKVVELIALLKTKKGATNEEAAKALKLKAKSDKPHHQPSALVRAMIRDKVRKLHTVDASEHDAERGGIVYTIK